MHSEIARQATPAVSRLEELFDTFNKVSVDLGSRYQALEMRVAELNTELAATHSARIEELTAKEELAARLSALMDTLPGGVLVLDANGMVREENPGAQSLLGESIVNRHWHAFLREAIGKGALDGGEVSLANGRRLCISSSAYGETGEQVVLLTDVSENHSLRSLINREERLAALGEMAARLAHQIRTPLSTAILYLSHLPQAGDSEKTTSVSKKILDRLRQIESLTDGMLSYIRGEARTHRVFSLSGIMQEVKDANSLLLMETGGRLTMELPADSCPIVSDKDAIFNALSNLVENAIQAATAAPRVTLTLRRIGENYQVIVADNGPGIDDTIREKIFDPFFSGRIGGTGLGLAVVLSAVKSCGGKIDVRTAKTGGAEIELLLPVNKTGSGHDTGIWVVNNQSRNKSVRHNTSERELAHG